MASAAGVAPGDVAQVAFGYGMFTGGSGLHYGLQRIGALVVRSARGCERRKWGGAHLWTPPLSFGGFLSPRLVSSTRYRVGRCGVR